MSIKIGNLYLVHVRTGNYKLLCEILKQRVPTKHQLKPFLLISFLNRYYHDNRNFTRLLTMLSNEVVARARQLVGEHVLENLLAVGSCFQFKCMHM